MYVEPTEEEVAAAREAHERAQMFGEMVSKKIKRMIAEELDRDQLEALGAMFTHISNSPNPIGIANWYEGIVYGVMASRDIMLGEEEIQL